MNLRSILIILVIFLTFGQISNAQKLKSTAPINATEIGPRDCTSRSPGSVSFGPIVGQSNDGRPDTIFLCYNDQIFIKNNGDGNFNDGDPVPGTPSAAGFLLYGCPPALTGPTFAAIQGDCVLSNPPPPPGELWYFMGTPNGDITLSNDGSTNAYFNAGSPFTLWLAPATFDAFTLSGGEYYGQYEDGGSCVKVNRTAAFPVVYLNEIKVTNFETNSPTSLSGSFDVTGGFPEFDASKNYTVTMVHKTKPTVKANLFGLPFEHGSKVTFAAPEPGTYILTISDGKSCVHAEEVILPQGNIDITVESGMVAMNDIICLDFTVKNLKDMVGGQFAIGFNPNLLQFDQIIIPGVNPLNLSLGRFSTSEAAQGLIRFLWDDASFTGKTLPDDAIFFTICFKAIGPPGTKTPVIITDIPSASFGVEFTNIDLTSFNVRYTAGIVMITNPTTIQVSLNVCSTTGNNGSITFTVYGPEAQYNYNFNNGAPSFVNTGEPFTISNLASGIYPLDVFNVSGVTHVISSITVSNAPPINVNSTITDPACNLSKDGKVDISSTGGVTPYAIEWSTFEFNKNSIDNLGSGVYNVTVTDKLGCIYTESFTLFTPSISLTPAVIVSPACSGKPTGSISITATGGTPKPGGTYDYKWSNNTTQNGVVSGSISGIPEGIYSVTITDANNCSVISNFELVPGVTIDATIDKQIPVCFGDGTGQITATGTTNGTTTGPYTFNWEASAGVPNNTNTTSIVSGLNNGFYDVTITDAAGCFKEKTIEIKGNGEIVFLIINKINDNCSGAPSGSATIYDGSGNTIPFPDPNNPGNGLYEFTWSNGSNPTTLKAVSLQLNNLSGTADGTRYYVTITGVDGCTADTSFLIFKKDAPLIEFDTLIPIACSGGNNGSIQATLTAKGSEITSVTWSNNAGLPVNSGDPNGKYFSTVSNLTGGQYILTVNTLSGCELKDTIVLEGQGSIAVDNALIVPTTCPDADDGSIQLTTSGGIMPYTYLWSNGEVTDAIVNIKVGSYTVTISDASGCPPFIDTYVVSSAPSIISGVDQNTIVASDCFDAILGSGSATVNASGGGIGTYSFTWSSGETFSGTSSTAVQLKGGWQFVTISDGNCNVVDSVFIPSPPAITANKATAQFTDVTCFGDNDGSITFVASGGNGGYSYTWSPVQTNTATLNGLGAGTYKVTISDNKNCIGVDSFKINEPAELVATLNSTITQDVNCFGESTGAIGVDVTGGNGSNTFTWNPAILGNVNTGNNLPAGNYLISVSDIKGCSDDVSVTLNEPLALSVNFGPVPEPACAGFETNFEINSITGGAGPDYKYTIDQGQTYTTFEIAKVLGGDHLLTITDENGCTLDSTFTVTEPAPILVSLPEDVVINLGDSILLSPVVLSAFPVGTSVWSPPSNVSCVNCDETYAHAISNQYINVLVTDVNGCSGIDSILLKVDKTRKIFIPNVFSPNKDGINDEFQIYTGPGVKEVMYVRVFNRYGALVYEQKNLPPSEYGTTNGWDGTFKGSQLNPDVFTYVSEISFLDGKTQLYFGSVTLVR